MELLGQMVPADYPREQYVDGAVKDGVLSSGWCE
jgi:hypothetical protein